MSHTNEWKARWKKPETHYEVLTEYNYLVHYLENLKYKKSF